MQRGPNPTVPTRDSASPVRAEVTREEWPLAFGGGVYPCIPAFLSPLHTVPAPKQWKLLCICSVRPLRSDKVLSPAWAAGVEGQRGSSAGAEGKQESLGMV